MSAKVGDCARCESALERGDLRCAVCALPAPAPAADAPVATLDVLRCTGCAAALAYDPEVQNARCAFCGAVLELETLADPVEQVEEYLPFRVTREEARQALTRWQSGLGWFRPGDLTSASRVTGLQPLWWVCWVFGARARVSWTADSDAGSRRAEWAPHAGTADVSVENVFVSASRGLTRKEADALAPSCDLRSRRVSPAGPDGAADAHAVIERFDVQRSMARGLVLDAVRGTLEASVARDQVPGTRHRNVHVEPLLEDLETLRLAAPAYVLAYRYRDALYRVVISGQDAACVIGKAPYSGTRIAAAAGAVLLVLLLVLLAVFA